MKTLVNIAKRAWVSGSWASIASTAALAIAGARDCRSVFAPVNAVSHWLWKDQAISQQKATLRYTVTGYAIHHLAAIFWAHLFEGLAGGQDRRRRSEVLSDAATVASVAAVVDLRCTPERLTPGFERRLSPIPLAGIYLAFGVGLALCARSRRQ